MGVYGIFNIKNIINQTGNFKNGYCHIKYNLI